MSGPVQSYQSPCLTPPDFWTHDADYMALLSVLSDEEQNQFGELLEQFVTAWGGNGTAVEVCDFLLRMENKYRVRP